MKYKIEEMDLDRDWAGIERLLVSEEWPFTFSDLEVSHQQDKAFGLIVRDEDAIRGFFTVHNFGAIAYLDLVIIEESLRRNIIVAKSLWNKVSEKIKQLGLDVLVAHCTNDSSPMLRFLRFKPGETFTLLRREEAKGKEGKSLSSAKVLSIQSLNELVELDSSVFGMKREAWIAGLLEQESTHFYGKYKQGKLVASVCLRERRDNAVCLDGCNSEDYKELRLLINEVISSIPEKKFECFVKTGSILHTDLLEWGFSVPDFFAPIGPLEELSKGDLTKHITPSENMLTMSWM